MPAEYIDDKDEALGAVGEKWTNINHVCHALRADKDVILAAMKNHRWAVHYSCNPDHFSDPEIRAALKTQGFAETDSDKPHRLEESITTWLDKQVPVTKVEQVDAVGLTRTDAAAIGL